MSGGSFNYLFRRPPKQNEYYVNQLRRMVERMKGSAQPGSGDVATILADHMDNVEHHLKIAHRSHEKHAGLMKAVEWFCSCDWGWDDVLEAAEVDCDSLAHQYLEEQTPPNGVSKMRFADGSALRIDLEGMWVVDTE